MKAVRSARGWRLGRAGAVAIGLAIAFLFAATARAEFMGDLLLIEAVSQEGTATFAVPVPGEHGSTIHWRLDSPQEMRAAGTNHLVATLNAVDINVGGDPVVNLTFSATAGGSGTTFTISSAVVSFPAMLNPVGSASADVTLTDSSLNGASVSPVSPATGTFAALYNGGGSTFAELLGPQGLSSGGTLTASETAGPQSIAGSVSNIQVQFRFTLSANDVASGHGRFEVVPEPSTPALLGLAALVMLGWAWRRWT